MRKGIIEYFKKATILLFEEPETTFQIDMKNPVCYFCQPPYRINQRAPNFIYPANETYQRYFMKYYLNEIIEILEENKNELDWSERRAIKIKFPEVAFRSVTIYAPCRVKDPQLKEYVETYNTETSVPMMLIDGDLTLNIIVSLPWVKVIDL